VVVPARDRLSDKKIAEGAAPVLPVMQPLWCSAKCNHHQSVRPERSAGGAKPAPDTDPGSKGVLRLRYATLSTNGSRKCSVAWGTRT